VDWSFPQYLAFLAEECWPGLLALAVTIPILILGGSPNRKLLAGAPGIIALLAFVLSSYIASLSTTDAVVPLAGLVLTALFVIPSVPALRHRWLGLLHILTLLAASYLWLICSLAIGGEAT
jgi:hypothetical protein